MYQGVKCVNHMLPGKIYLEFYVLCYKVFYKFLPYTKGTLPMEILKRIDLKCLDMNGKNPAIMIFGK